MNRWFALLIVLQTGIYGAGTVIMKIAYEGITPLWCSALRFGLAFVLLLCFFGKRYATSMKSTKVTSWLPSGLLMSLSFITCSISVNLTSATNAGFFVSLPMLFTPILALAITGKRYTIRTAALQIVVVAGLYLLCCNTGKLHFGLGELFGLVSSASFAGMLVFAQRGLETMDPISLSISQIGITFLGALAFALIAEPIPNFAAVPIVSWEAIAFLAVIGTCLAMALQNIALSHISPVFVSIILCSEPVFTAVISACLLGEMLGFIGIVGATVIVLGTVVASIESSKATKPRAANGLHGN